MQRETSCESRVRVEDERVRRSDIQQTDVAEKVDGEVGSEDVPVSYTHLTLPTT